MVPDILVVLNRNIIVWLPSVVKSAANVLVIVAVLELITTDPLLLFSVKSPATVEPELVQYSVVPLATLVVVTVNVTLSPSLTDATLGAMA